MMAEDYALMATRGSDASVAPGGRRGLIARRGAATDTEMNGPLPAEPDKTRKDQHR